MPKFIYKYDVSDIPKIPTGSKLLHIAPQDGELKLWCEVYPSNPPGGFEALGCGTGFIVPEHLGHAGTWFEGPFVWHLYVSKELL